MSETTITPEAVANYVHQGGGHCPFCGSLDISGGSIDIDGSGAWQLVTCADCHREWHDVYDLAGIGDPEKGDVVRPVPHEVGHWTEEDQRDLDKEIAKLTAQQSATPIDDSDVFDAMAKYGGGFAKHLAEAWRRADPTNNAKLRIAFDGYWRLYSKMAAEDAARRAGR